MSVTKLLSLQMESSAITLYQVEAHSSDDLHEHTDFYQISIPLIGTPQMQCNSEVRRVDGQQRLVLSPGYRHRHFAGEETARMMLIFFHHHLLQKVLADRTERPSAPVEFSPWGEGATDAFRQLAERAVIQTMQRPMETLELQELEWEMANLLLTLHDGSHAVKPVPPGSALLHPVVRRVAEYIHDQSASEITLDRLTAVSGLSKYHLIRLFREKTGQTPSQYHTEVRLSRAASLLKKTRLDITSIAFEAGFGSLSAFERAFRKSYRMSASEFRRQMER